MAGECTPLVVVQAAPENLSKKAFFSCVILQMHFSQLLEYYPKLRVQHFLCTWASAKSKLRTSSVC
jgi:hypothetical protein